MIQSQKLDMAGLAAPLLKESGDKLKNKWKFSELLADPVIRDRWEKVKKYFFLRETTYDMSNRCNLKCDGCYYYEGEKQFTEEIRDPEAWRTLMREEKKRGITYVVLAGAEPSLSPELLQICHDEISLGSIATNGFKRIPESVDYMIHISVWGNDETTERIRGAKNLLKKQISNYKGDPRAVFVYTFTKENIKEVYEVTKVISENKCKITFNMFSSPVGYSGNLRHNKESLANTRKAMIDLLQKYPENVLFSPYSAVAHTHEKSLHGLYSCSYPRVNKSTDIGLGRSFRQYRTNLSWDRSAACCVPDTDCADCRHYASGSAVVTSRLYRHAINPESFKSWLDYADTYLSIWVRGYKKSKNLCDVMYAPPGNGL
jgi:MoaA/NifB/PqqE/SkfB family radical SAM enzyme